MRSGMGLAAIVLLLLTTPLPAWAQAQVAGGIEDVEEEEDTEESMKEYEWSYGDQDVSDPRYVIKRDSCNRDICRVIYPPIPNPDALIEECRNVSEERFGTTAAEMINTDFDTIDCLNVYIKKNLRVVMSNRSLYGDEKIKSVDELVDMVNFFMRNFYLNLFNNSRRCPTTCGSAGKLEAYSETVTFLEELLWMILEERDRQETRTWPEIRQVPERKPNEADARFP